MSLRHLFFGRHSGGVRVGRAAFRAIFRGDAARHRGDWARAAAHYSRALKQEPRLAHIWIQLGHAAKEAGQLEQADAAYLRAAELEPVEVEALIRRGHMWKAQGDATAAARAFVTALRRRPGHLPAAAELARLLPEREAQPQLWADALACLDIDKAEFVPADPALPPRAVVLDVTDLLAYLGQSRLPSGIQRVQLEILLALLARGGEAGVSLCVYIAARRAWTILPNARVDALCRQALASGGLDDPDWHRTLRTMFALIAASPVARFGRGCVLMNLGTTWSDPTYLVDVAAARAGSALVYVAWLFDLIPILHPEWFVPSLVGEFTPWVERLLAVADGIVTISESSAADLGRIAAEQGHAFAPGAVRVVRLDGDFSRDRVVPAPPGDFVLFVSTIEPRKNHLGAFAAWRRLIDELGEAQVPDLVCVGGGGWLNEAVHARLRDDPVLARKVRLRSGVSDDELAGLYAGCRFTLYPSLYEGWGLPISESLAYGKVPAIGRGSSMPEAGGAFAVYFDAADPRAIAAAVRPLMTDPAHLAKLEAAVAAGYRPRGWPAIADETVAAARDIARLSGAAPA